MAALVGLGTAIATNIGGFRDKLVPLLGSHRRVDLDQVLPALGRFGEWLQVFLPTAVGIATYGPSRTCSYRSSRPANITFTFLIPAFQRIAEWCGVNLPPIISGLAAVCGGCAGACPHCDRRHHHERDTAGVPASRDLPYRENWQVVVAAVAAAVIGLQLGVRWPGSRPPLGYGRYPCDRELRGGVRAGHSGALGVVAAAIGGLAIAWDNDFLTIRTITQATADWIGSAFNAVGTFFGDLVDANQWRHTAGNAVHPGCSR